MNPSTVNAMAILIPGGSGEQPEMIDPFNGLADLATRTEGQSAQADLVGPAVGAQAAGAEWPRLQELEREEVRGTIVLMHGELAKGQHEGGHAVDLGLDRVDPFDVDDTEYDAGGVGRHKK